MADLAEYVDGLPNISGSEERIRQAIQASRTDPVFLPQGASGFGEINSAFALALHMHQPLIPAGGPELRTAQMISNLRWMLDNPDSGDNHNARVFLWCYKRMGEFVLPLRSRTTAFTSRPGSTTLPPSLALTRFAGSAASRPQKWRFPAGPTWLTN